ncbi:MAG: polysaccharide biosynthesis/export family protein [Arachidicoccus sp.]|nr:polysaccharide biosynthesis/export family protein [Arachidicoccus sp.]
MDKKRLLTLSIILISLSCLIQSCATKRNLVYFSNLPDSVVYKEVINNNIEPTIQPNDLLNIKVATLSPDANILFNSGSLPMNNAQTGTAQSADNSALQLGYLVDENGQIDFPILGKLSVGGLTREQAMGMISEKVGETAKDPIVNLQIMNFRVSVIGEVTHAGVFNIPNNKVNVLEALGMAGDITPYAERQDVLVIHEKDKMRSVSHLNLNDKNVFNSPSFYLQQNDVVYVRPENQLKVQSVDTKFNRKFSIITTAASLIISIITLIVVSHR